MQIIHLLFYNYFIFLDSSSGPDHLSALQIFWEGCFWWAEAITITIIRFNVFQLLLKTTFSLIYYCFTYNLPKPAAPPPPFSLFGFLLLLKKEFFSYKTLFVLVTMREPALYLKEKPTTLQILHIVSSNISHETFCLLKSLRFST